MEIKNEFMVGGLVIDKGKDRIMVKTTGLNFDGTQEFDHKHPILLTDAELKKTKKGMRVLVMGEFTTREEENGRRTRLQGNIVHPNWEGEDVNYGEVVGKAHQTFRSFPRTSDKREFGNLLVNLGEGLIVQVVLFAPTCLRFNRECTQGSVVKGLGRIQHREYEDFEQKTQIMTEIVGADAHCEVLEPAGPVVNPMDEIRAMLTANAI